MCNAVARIRSAYNRRRSLLCAILARLYAKLTENLRLKVIRSIDDNSSFQKDILARSERNLGLMSFEPGTWVAFVKLHEKTIFLLLYFVGPGGKRLGARFSR